MTSGCALVELSIRTPFRPAENIALLHLHRPEHVISCDGGSKPQKNVEKGAVHSYLYEVPLQAPAREAQFQGGVAVILSHGGVAVNRMDWMVLSQMRERADGEIYLRRSVHANLVLE